MDEIKKGSWCMMPMELMMHPNSTDLIHRVYAAIAMFSDGQGHCQLSQQQVADYISSTRNNVNRAISWLINNGFIPSWNFRKPDSPVIDLPSSQSTSHTYSLSPGEWHKARLRIIARDGLVCGICGGNVEPDDVHIDHIIPASKGGSDNDDNLQVAHSRCNQLKHNRV